MIIPISTDAPIYHWPWMTLVLIGANAITFLVTGFGHDYDGWILSFGHGMRPLEWIAYSFFHVNGFQLLINAFFLWGFGIVVEGKIGWWKFLTMYLGIAICGGALIQGLMLNHKPRAMPRLQIPNPNAAPADAPTAQTAPPPAGQPNAVFPGTNPVKMPNQNPPPQFSGRDMDDDGADSAVDVPRRDRGRDDGEFGERSRDGSVMDILFGNPHVFTKPGIKGASLMIYALLAITLVWAPRNEITCFVLKIPPGTFEAEYLYFCGFRVIMQVLYAWMTDFRPTEEFGHFFGVVAGFGTGTLLLKKGWVDCENWDLFAVLSGTHGNRARVGGWQERDGLTNEIATPDDGESAMKPSKKKKTPFQASIYAADDTPKKNAKSSRSKSRPSDEAETESSESSQLDDALPNAWNGFLDDCDLETLEPDESADAATKPKPSKKVHLQKQKSEPEPPAIVPTLTSPATTPKRTPVDASTYVAQQIREAQQAEQFEVAVQLYRGHKTSHPNWDLDEADLVALADALHKTQRWNDAAPLMEHCVTRFPNSSLRTRVKLAGIFVEIQRRPRAAMALLKEISRTMVPEKLQSHFDAITSLAQQLIEMSIEDRAPPA